ncbi:MAG: hypothetical protein AAGA80_07420 [Cyanobacteria bacterium P01_F01_bin.143]
MFSSSFFLEFAVSMRSRLELRSLFLQNQTALDCEQSTSENIDFSHPHY